MKVLLGLWSGDDSPRALDATVERAVEAGDDLTVAVVEDPDAEGERTASAVLDRVESRLAAADIDATVRRLDGPPGSALVDLAEGEGFDRLVVGGGQTSPMGKIRVGDVVEFVLLNSHVTVTLVR
jgi:nucleotide-binding universal stress UspA family protein